MFDDLWLRFAVRKLALLVPDELLRGVGHRLRLANRWLEQMLKRVETISKSLTAISAVIMGLLMIFVMVGIFQLAIGLMDSIQH